MALPVNHALREYQVFAYSSSIGASPIVAYVRVPRKGRIVSVGVVQNGAVTGTTAVALAINGGSAISSGALAVTAGAAGTAFRADLNSTDTADVSEDDVISFTPSSGTGASITGAFWAVIRT
jgi:hypothetical protein